MLQLVDMACMDVQRPPIVFVLDPPPANTLVVQLPADETLGAAAMYHYTWGEATHPPPPPPSPVSPGVCSLAAESWAPSHRDCKMSDGTPPLFQHEDTLSEAPVEEAGS